MKGAPMTVRPAEPDVPPVESEAVVWIDHERALVIATEADGSAIADVLGRGPGETELAFEERAVDDILDAGRVVVSGPLDARTSFERAYVGITHRPDRLVDAELTADGPPSRHRGG